MDPNQQVSTIAQVGEALMQYGVLGILAFLLGYFAWTSYNRLLEKNEALEKKVDTLQQEMVALISEERDRMADLIQKNTAALNELSRTILEYIVSDKRN